MGRRHPHKRFHHKKHFRRYSFFQRVSYFCRKHPIISAGGSDLIGVVLMRASFSNILFGNNIKEFRLWVLFASIVFLIIGAIAFIIWLKRNVPSFYTKHDVNWRNR
ncbi:hypothetical protein HYV79_03935 [Candidatus Woesearchaeota archaeon]|nr:hypothetical protein [Candidatus Woesearchaeota archaeon]